MNFIWKQGLIWVPVELLYDGKRVRIENCIIDTGSASTAIDIDLVEFNFDRKTSIKRLTGIGGGTQEVLSQNVDVFFLILFLCMK